MISDRGYTRFRATHRKHPGLRSAHSSCRNPRPSHHPDPVVYADNTIGSYNALSAASALGIKRVCLRIIHECNRGRIQSIS